MSKRFGRNQRRKMREQLAAAQLQARNNRIAADTHAKTIDAIGTALDNERTRAYKLERLLQDAKRYLGENSPAFPPNRTDPGYKPYRDEPFYLQGRRGPCEAVAMQVVRRDSEDMRDQVHFLLFAGPEQWGYAITKRALTEAPREVIAQHIVTALVDMMLDKMNRGRG